MGDERREIHRTINVNSILDFKPVNNYVLCRRVRSNFNPDEKTGLIKATHHFNRDQYLPQNVERVFEVISLPDKLDENIGHYWHAEIELKIGDYVIVEYFASLFSNVMMADGYEYRAIPYYKIITKIEQSKNGGIWDRIQPINGYILFTPVYEKMPDFIIVPDSAKRIDPRYGMIEFVSPANKYYLREKKEYLDQDIKIKKGDKVMFIKVHENVDPTKFAPILENKMHKVLGKMYYYCQRSRIAAKMA